MVYHWMCGYPPAWIGEVVQEVHELSGKPVWPIIQSVDDPALLAPEEYGACPDVALGHPASGGVVFTMGGAERGQADCHPSRIQPVLSGTLTRCCHSGLLGGHR